MAATLYAGSARFTTHEPDRVTRHSFSFGPHYDPANLGFGPLVCHNDEILQPGGGYPDHPHRDLEIVTWVLSGVLLHTDSTGHTSPIGAGSVQAMSAGSGIRHAEIAAPASGPTRFVQAWVRPDEPGGTPVHRELAVDLAGAGLVPVAGDSGLPIGTTGASLHVARLAPGESVELPDAHRLHVFAATGSVSVGDHRLGAGDERLGAGDALRLVDEGGVAVADEPTDLLVWSFT
ncbi:pirin family protein [Nocardioides sediminis]|uniref:pirin family protein n=1 Tax=Nocardioides sediminis TaxID=433648 RepID=UPI000D30C94C|nr:pirin family protein [Nocardioides sediminis]